MPRCSRLGLALGLGKVLGVPTMGAVIALVVHALNGDSDPRQQCQTVTGQNTENYGVPPDVYVDNTPADFVKAATRRSKRQSKCSRPKSANDHDLATIEPFVKNPT